MWTQRWHDRRLAHMYCISKCTTLPFKSTETDRLRQRGISDVQANHDTTEADLILFPPVSPAGSPCWSAPRLPLSTPGRTNPRIRGCGGVVCVCVCVSDECRGCCLRSAPTTSASQSHREETRGDIKSSYSYSFLLVFFTPLHSLPGPCSACVCKCVRRQAACPVSDCEFVWVCECVWVCVSSRTVTVCHTGRRAGRQPCVHFIIAVMTGIS